MTTLSLDDCIGHLDSGFSGLVHFNDYMALVEHPPAAGGAAGHVVQTQRGGGGGDKDKDKEQAKKGEFLLSASLCVCLYV